MVFMHRPRSPSLAVHSGTSCSDTGKGVTPRTAQKWTKSFLGVVYMCLVWELSPQQRYPAAWGGRLPLVCQVSGALFAISTADLGRG